MTLPILRDRAALRRTLADWRREGRSVALVPTMGALHAGHLSLMRLARSRCDRVLATVFVNPAQFGPGEDFAAYPRDEARDAALLAGAGCDALHAPGVDDVYPPGFATTVNVAGITEALEGAVRPGHFAGVATVVAKLLIRCAPDAAVFGEKDYQQLLLIHRLAADLDLAVDIVAAPIVREADGLALSSRNAYLDQAQRRVAPALHRALRTAAEALSRGASVAVAEQTATDAIQSAGFEAVDYVEARGVDDLARLGPGPLAGPARLLAAARLGRTRLLDNVAVAPA